MFKACFCVRKRIYGQKKEPKYNGIKEHEREREGVKKRERNIEDGGAVGCC